MRHNAFPLATQDGLHLHVNHWHGDQPPRAVVMLAHGMAEHSLRYARLAESLVAAGFGEARGLARSTVLTMMERLRGNAEAPAAKEPPSEPVAPEHTFLGREAQLARLREAYETMRGGRGVTADSGKKWGV